MRTLELFLLGFAAIIDLALLLALWERVNRGRVAVWLTGLVASITLIHVAIFVRLLIADASGESFVIADRALMIVTCAGLLLLPSAMLHAAIRLHHTGIDPYPPQDPRYRWLYSPMLLLPFVGATVWMSPAADFIAAVGLWKFFYLAYTTAVNAVSVWLFLKIRGRGSLPHGDAFLFRLSCLIVFVNVAAVMYAAFGVDTSWETPLRLLAIISPLAAALLFVWHSMRGRLLPVVMERTFIYAVALALLLLAHRLLLTPLIGWMRVKTNIDFFLVEGILLAAVILLVPKLRSRVAESLRSLFSTNVVHVRNAIRQTALKLSQNAVLDSDVLTQWFADELRQSLQLEHVVIMIDEEVDKGQLAVIVSGEERDESEHPSSANENRPLIHNGFRGGQRILELGAIEDSHVERAMVDARALLAYRMDYRSVSGTVLLGNRIRNDRLVGDQVHVLSIVVDQFAATLHNRREEMRRQQAERKMLQQEKLSVLGLLSGSLAHEIRNPLSSIRTIVTLVMEDLGESNECYHELQMIITEIDRLSQTTNRLLDYARPEPQTQALVNPDQIISRIVYVLDYLAKQFRVETKLDLRSSGIMIESNEASFSEIVFNLVKNAIEAAKGCPDGKVEIQTQCNEGNFQLSIGDNGCGIAEEQKGSLFKPFATFKADGNGLGLYAVNERVRELDGQIAFRANQPCGTVFEVRLPMARRNDHSGR